MPVNFAGMPGGQQTQLKGSEAEKYAHELASRKYFSRWCHVNPLPVDEPNHELCDLLIAWGEIVITFSIKNYAFKGNYVRHQRKTVEKGIEQISGAHRKLLRTPSFTVVEQGARRTVTLPDYAQCKVLRVVLNLGEPVLFYYAIERDQAGNLVHIFDRSAFDGIVNELDTIPELVDYLTKRQEWMSDKEFTLSPGKNALYTPAVNAQFQTQFPKREDSPHRRFSCTGHELDLLSAFLRNNRNWPADFVSPFPKGMVIDYDGEWDRLCADPKFIKRKEADGFTSLVDALITEILGKPENERMAFELSYLTRFDRRQLAQSLFGFLASEHPTNENYIGRRFMSLARYDMVFVHFGGVHDDDSMRDVLGLICDMYRYHKVYDKDSRLIMILASDRTSVLRQYAMLGYEGRFPAEHELKMERLKKQWGWFTNERVAATTQNEYPD
ncbi:MAG: hypothetical protein JSU02_00925 [Bacteroidetes bacterium]|nr:hypothetical protein [Bacteroidota bacterium]